MGNCLAGDGCPFSHDPSSLIGNMSLSDGNSQSAGGQQPAFQIDNNYDAFPALQPVTAAGEHWMNPYVKYSNNLTPPGHKYPGQFGGGRRNGSNSRPHSRPTSRHQQRDSNVNATAPSVDDPDAFPTLSAVSAKNPGKKGKRGNQTRESNLSKESTPSSLADVVRMSPSPGPGKGKSSSKNSKEAPKSRENSAAAQAIPAPKHIPWLETGARANQQYIKYRTDAIRHGTVRNKFLQRYALVNSWVPILLHGSSLNPIL